jgi:hypothetical protein
MKRLHAVALLTPIALLFACGSPVSPTMLTEPGPAFPTCRGSNLEGREFEVPAGLDGGVNVLLVAFQRWQQRDVDTWIPAAKAAAAAYPDVEYYELPVLSSGWTPLRGWIDGGMRSGIPNVSARERTITIYTDKGRFMELMDLTTDEAIWVGVVTKDGRVTWSTTGPATEAGLRALEDAIRSARALPE